MGQAEHRIAGPAVQNLLQGGTVDRSIIIIAIRESVMLL